jgi:hypothetical protein
MCLQFRANDALLGTVQDPHGGEGDLKWTCQICQCPCVATYLRSQIQAIGFQLEENKRKGERQKAPEPKELLSQMIGQGLGNARLQLYQTGNYDYDLTGKDGEESFNHNILAFAGTQMVANPFLNANTTMRNKILTAIGPLSRREVLYCHVLGWTVYYFSLHLLLV